MAVGNITTTTAANFIPEIWSPECKIAREANLVAAKTVNRDYEGEIREFGDTVRITDISNLTSREKSANTDVTYEAIAEEKTDLIINKHYYAAFKLEDIVKIQSRVDLRAKYTQKVGYALAKQIDSDVLAHYSGFSQSVGSPATDLTDPNLLAAIEYLDLADAPAGDRSLILYPTQMNAILSIDKFVRADAVGYLAQMSPVVTGHLAKGSFNPSEVKGYFGQIYGVDVYVSTNVPRTGSSPVSTHNVLWHKDAIVLALQQDVRIQSEYDIDALATKVVADVLYGSAELRNEFAVHVLT